MIRAATAVLGFRDVRAAAEYFRDVLGFTIENLVNDPPTFASLIRDGAELFLQRVATPRPFDLHAWSLYLHCADAKALHDEAVAKGAEVSSPLVDKIYGMREFELAGPENTVIVFGQPIQRAD
jgi:uncharacterized glyoxalase superfamily protein PhnB